MAGTDAANGRQPTDEDWFASQPPPPQAPGTASVAGAPAQAGMFANSQQGFLDWAGNKYGVDPTRGAGFVDAQAGGGLQKMLADYTAATGNRGQFLGGPSGDRVDFGAGAQDALTSGGQIWNPAGAPGGADDGGSNRGGVGGGGNQFGALYGGGQMGPGGAGGGYGQAPGGYQSAPWTGGDYTPPPMPEGLKTPYSAPQWQGGDFKEPTMGEVQATPGYQTRLDAGRQARERGAAAQGSVLSGGTQKALERYGQDYGAEQYQQARGNAFQDYMTKYGQFQDQSNMGLNARQQNVGEYNTAVGQGNQTYQNRYGQYLGENQRTLSDYLTNVTTKRNAQNDYWSQLRDLYQGGQSAATGSYKPGIGTQ